MTQSWQVIVSKLSGAWSFNGHDFQWWTSRAMLVVAVGGASALGVLLTNEVLPKIELTATGGVVANSVVLLVVELLRRFVRDNQAHAKDDLTKP